MRIATTTMAIVLIGALTSMLPAQQAEQESLARSESTKGGDTSQTESAAAPLSRTILSTALPSTGPYSRGIVRPSYRVSRRPSVSTLPPVVAGRRFDPVRTPPAISSARIARVAVGRAVFQGVGVLGP